MTSCNRLKRRLDHELFLLWKRQVFCRHRHRELTELVEAYRLKSGVYFIGCADQIVYIGQTLKLHQRPIESIGNIYHRVPDTTVPWSLAVAPCALEELNEREAAAIRTYAPKFNYSVPSRPINLDKMPRIASIVPVFSDQEGLGDAFCEVNLASQMQIAANHPSPPWKVGKVGSCTTAHFSDAAITRHRNFRNV